MTLTQIAFAQQRFLTSAVMDKNIPHHCKRRLITATLCKMLKNKIKARLMSFMNLYFVNVNIKKL